MSTDQERLVVALEARIRDFERSFQRANKTASSNFDQIERRAKQSADRLETSMSTVGKGMNAALGVMKAGLAGLVAGASVAALEGIISRTAEIAKGVASIGDEARRAGLSVKAFQELKFVAEQNRLGIDSLVDGIKELNLRADEWIVTGAGPAAEAFQRLGYDAATLKRKLADPSALFSEIIGKLGQLDKAAQIRIADEVFGGTGGEKFVQLIAQGEAGIRKTIKSANDLGLVLDEEIIARADEIDRKFGAISATVATALKGAVVDIVGAMDDWLDRFNKIEEQTDRNVQSALVAVYAKIADAKAQLEDLQKLKIAFPDDAAVDLNIDRQKEALEDLTNEALRLRDILDRRSGYTPDFKFKTTAENAKAASGAVNTLNSSLTGTGNATAAGAKGINSYAEAIRSLKDEIPELAQSLAQLDAQARIDSVYRAAVGKARTMGEVYQANELRNRALQSLNIKSATDDPSGYLSTVLASGKPASHITGMQSDFAGKLAKMLASMPEELKGQITINSGFRSIERQQELWLAALKKYGSPEAARKWVAPPGNSQHNKGYAADLAYGSDAARQWAHANAAKFGLSFPLANENWHIEDESARAAARAEQVKQQTDALTQQAEAYRSITDEARAFMAEQATEQQALGLTAVAASKLRYEQQMLADAQRQGIELTPQQRAEISQLAQGMAEAEQATLAFAQTQEQAQQASQFFASTAGNALTGLITGTMDAKTALKQLTAQIAQAALQAALLGQGPLAGLMGGGQSGGILGSLFSAFIGAKDGGEIQTFARGGRVKGPGTSRSDSVPAWLSDGEYVINAKAASKHRKTLEAINAGRTPVLPKVEIGSGGGVGRTVENVTNTFAPTIPITVQASGHAESDETMRKRLREEMTTLLDAQMVKFVQKQQRPGGMFNRKRFT